jgi:hypothetical protein
MAAQDSDSKIRGFEYLFAALAPVAGFFILWGPRVLNGENIFLGAIQEQYFLLGQYSFDHLIREELAAGLFPLWNPNNALGAPLLGNMLSAAFYPLKIYLYMRPSLLAYELYVVCRFWVAGFFAYILARKLKLSVGASAFVLFGFIFSGYFQLFLNENYLNADFLLPLLVLLGLMVSQSRSKKWPILLALCLFALFNSGHPEAIFYSWLFAALSFAGFVSSADRRARPGAAARFIYANLIAVFLSLPLIFLFMEYWVRGYNFHLPGAGLYHYSVRELLAAFSPWFFGRSAPGAAFFRPPELSAGFQGLIPGYAQSTLPWLAPAIGIIFLPLLALAAVELKKLPGTYLIWFAWLIFSLALSFGLPVFHILGLVWPFSFSGNFKHPWPALILSACLIGAWALEKIFSGKIAPRKMLFAIIASILLLAVFFPYSHADNALKLPVIMETGIAAIFLGWIFISRELKWRAGFGFGLACLVLMLSASLRISWQEPAYPNYNLIALRQNPIFSDLRRDKLARFYFDREIFPPNINQLLDVAELSVMDGVNHRKFVELVNYINGHTREQGFKYWYNKVGFLEVMPEKIEDPLVNLTGVKYVVSRTPLPYSRTVERLLLIADRVAPSADHIGPAYFNFRNAFAKTLFEHPPSKISVNRCDLYRLTGEEPPACSPHAPAGSILPAMSVSFAPRIQREAIAKEPGGVWFMMRNGAGLSYARYIHPRRQAYESDLARSKFSISDESMDFSLATLPANNADYDWSGWVDLRIDEASEVERFKLVGADHFWFYENPDAMPRFYMAESGEWEKGIPEEWRSEIVFFKVRVKAAEENAPEPEITVKNFTSQGCEVWLDNPSAGWLVISQIFYPGWRAYVDGAEQKIEQKSFLGALDLSAGKHRIEIIYKPWSFAIALYASLATVMALVVFAALKFQRPEEFESKHSSN